MSQPPLPWRQNVGMIILNPHQEVWMGRRSKAYDYPWQFPQGGIDNDETPEQAMWRELEEEVGINQTEIIAEYPDWLYYELPADMARARGFCGQQQKWFLLRYDGLDEAITINHEFSSWSWFPCSDLGAIIETMVVPFKRSTYCKLLVWIAENKLWSQDV